MKVILADSAADPVRTAFMFLDKKRDPMEGSDGEAKFEVTLILKPGGANEKAVQNAIAQVAKEKYGDDWQELYKEFADDQKGLRKGNLKRDRAEQIYDGFEGNSYVVAKNVNRPAVFTRSNVAVVAGEAGFPYAGCHVNAEIDVWALKKPGVKKRIVINILGAQMSRDGDAFSAAPPPSTASTFQNLSAADDGEAGDGASSTGGKGGSVFD